MAELRVERKRPSIWRWIVLLLIIALLVWAIVELFGVGDSTAPTNESPQPSVVAPLVGKTPEFPRLHYMGWLS